MEFKIDSIVLRKPEEKDANGFIDICSEKETMRYYGVSGADIDTHEKAMGQSNGVILFFSRTAEDGSLQSMEKTSISVISVFITIRKRIRKSKSDFV